MDRGLWVEDRTHKTEGRGQGPGDPDSICIGKFCSSVFIWGLTLSFGTDVELTDGAKVLFGLVVQVAPCCYLNVSVFACNFGAAGSFLHALAICLNAANHFQDPLWQTSGCSEPHVGDSIIASTPC